MRNAVLLVAVSLATTSCGRSKGQTITIKGSDTMVILGQSWAETYMHHNPGIKVQVTGGGTGTGIAALINGGTDICQASRPIKDKEREQVKSKWKKEIKSFEVALDGLAIFVHESNPLAEISIPQLEQVYSGRITDWKDLGGAPRRIVCYGRENSSGTYAYFKEHVLKERDFATEVQTLPGTAAVINAVSKDPQSIGYGGIGYSKGVRAIRVRAATDKPACEPTMANVVSGVYPISRKLYFYTVGEPAVQAKAFIDWVLSEEGQKICEKVGYYPLPRK